MFYYIRMEDYFRLFDIEKKLRSKGISLLIDDSDSFELLENWSKQDAFLDYTRDIYNGIKDKVYTNKTCRFALRVISELEDAFCVQITFKLKDKSLNSEQVRKILNGARGVVSKLNTFLKKLKVLSNEGSIDDNWEFDKVLPYFVGYNDSLVGKRAQYFGFTNKNDSVLFKFEEHPDSPCPFIAKDLRLYLTFFEFALKNINNRRSDWPEDGNSLMCYVLLKLFEIAEKFGIYPSTIKIN